MTIADKRRTISPTAIGRTPLFGFINGMSVHEMGFSFLVGHENSSFVKVDQTEMPHLPLLHSVAVI